MKILFLMHSVNYDRLFENALDALLARGHEVRVAFDRHKSDSDTATFAALRARWPRLDFGPAPSRTHAVWPLISRGLRSDRDYLRYLEPSFATAVPLRERARERAHRSVAALASTPGIRSSAGRRILSGTLARLDRAVPLDPAVLEFVRGAAPDVVIVTPLVNFGSPQDDYVRAARALRIPVVLAVASWDNLTNKGLVREPPDLTLVWNEVQKREAIELHGLDRDSVVVTGAHSYDHWFTWQPSTGRSEFRRRVGFDGDKPFLLYVGSSSFIAPHEPIHFRTWLERLRRTEVAALRDIDVLVRPHPTNSAGWADLDVRDLGARVWPAAGERLRAEESKAAYFDSLHHSNAVVGLNTSALIEAAIVGRPVLTVLEEATAERQVGTLHFAYIAEGVLRVADSWDEHTRQLADAVEQGADGREEAFVKSFIRPHGLENVAAELFADAIEGAQLVQPARRDETTASTALRPILLALAVPVGLRRARKRVRRRWLHVRMGVRAVLRRGFRRP